VADVNPPNLLILLFDNSYYARMGQTFTARRADLEKIAQGAGIKDTAMIQTLEAFSSSVKRALQSTGPTFLVMKVEAERERFVKGDADRTYGRAMREFFSDAVRSHPDRKTQ
jgi:thiamine pyrophosphate-dependent acetolactate synthase large subunit-like protein